MITLGVVYWMWGGRTSLEDIYDAMGDVRRIIAMNTILEVNLAQACFEGIG